MNTETTIHIHDDKALHPLVRVNALRSEGLGDFNAIHIKIGSHTLKVFPDNRQQLADIMEALANPCGDGLDDPDQLALECLTEPLPAMKPEKPEIGILRSLTAQAEGGGE